jgi:hypothetical protein
VFICSFIAIALPVALIVPFRDATAQHVLIIWVAKIAEELQ